MRVLLACEESQAVCTEFRERGHEAFSCDLLDCSGNHPEWHIKGDVLEIIKEKLLKALGTVERFSGKHISLPVLSFVLLEAKNDMVFLRATNL